MTVTEARRALGPKRAFITFSGVSLEVMQPTKAFAMATAGNPAAVVDLARVSACVFMPGTDEQVFPKPNDVTSLGERDADELAALVKSTVKQWEPKGVEPMPEPPEAKAAREAIEQQGKAAD